MKKVLVILLSLLMVVSVFAQKGASAPKGRVEEGAKIRIGVDNDEWGAAIVELWNKTYPRNKGALEYEYVGAAGATDYVGQLQGDAADVVLCIDGEVSRQAQSLLEMDKTIAKFAATFAIEPFYSNTNETKNVYVPVAYDGMVFSWNKTMCEAIGLDTTDADGDGLPEAFDTWEEIFAWSASLKDRPVYKGKKINVVYPMSLANQWGCYSSLTAGGWQIYAEGDTSKPGFDKPEFKAGLDFLREAAKAKISVEANGQLTPGSSMAERWQEYLDAEISPFALVGSWMDVKGAEAATGSDFKFSRMPTWKGNQLTPLVKTKGFVINGFTRYPGAAKELVKLLVSKAGMQLMVDHSSYIPAIQANAPTLPDFSNEANKREMQVGFAACYAEPSDSLPINKQMACMQCYYNIAIEQSYFPVWDGEKSSEDAQAEIVKNAKNWFDTNNR